MVITETGIQPYNIQASVVPPIHIIFDIFHDTNNII